MTQQMSRLCALIVGVLVIVSTAPVAAETRDVAFGEKLKLTAAEELPVAKVLAAPAEYADKYVRLTGKIDAVCARRGCWLSLTGEGATESMMVRFTCPIDGRLIPMEALGREVVVEGKVEVKEVTEAMARHMKEEAGATAEEIAKVVGPHNEVRLASPAALVRGMPEVAATQPATRPTGQ